MIQTEHVIDYSIPAMAAWRDLPDDTYAEVICGKLYILTAPGRYHAEVSASVMVGLAGYVLNNGLGKVYTAPFAVYLMDTKSILLPDLIFVSNENLDRIDDVGIHGGPDLCIEILSPSTRSRDLKEKKRLYEEGGVKEYWAIDPKTKNAQGFLLRDGKYDDPLLLNAEIYVHILSKSFKFENS